MAPSGIGGMSPERLAEVALMIRSKGALSMCSKADALGGAEVGERRGERLGALRRAVGDHHRGRLQPQQRREDAAGRAARADDQHAAVGDHQSEVVAQVAHQAGAVGVVAEDAVALDRERVDRRRVRGARGELVRDVDRGDLVGQGDVEPAAATAEELRTRARNSSGFTS